MRPIKLVMNAFGPYSNEEIIDFEELGQRNLFLITGPTGAGKTTIFDGISYAIYGKASGDLRSGESLRSQFAEVGRLTEVRLDFELKGNRYLIKRAPAQLKPKVHGEGETQFKGEVELIHYGIDNKVFTGVKSVEEKINEIMGINVEQFKQIMMLPQGEFRQLLVADSKDRESILKQIFDTSVLSRLQMKLEDESKKLYGEIKNGRLLKTEAFRRLESDTDEILVDLLNKESINEGVIIERVHDLIEGLEQQAETISEALNQLNLKIERIAEEKEKAAELNRLLDKKKQIEAELLQLETAEAEIEAVKMLLIEIDEIRPILGREEQVRQLVIRIEKDTKEQESLEKAYVVLKEEQEIVAKRLEELDSEESIKYRQHLVESYNTSKGYLAKVEGIQTLTEQLDQLEKAIRKEEERVGSLKVTKNKHLQEIETIKDQKALATEANIKKGRQEVALQELKYQLKQLKEIENLVNKTNLLQKDLNTEDKDCQVHLNQLETLKSKYTNEKMKYYLNQAAILAKALKEQTPCPVCGSLEHPAKAKENTEAISEEALADLENQVQKAERIVAKKQQLVTTLKEQMRELNQLISSSLKEHQLEENQLSEAVFNVNLEFKKALKEIDAIETRLSSYGALEEKGKVLECKLIQLESELTEGTKTLQTQKEASTIAKTQLESINQEVPEPLRKLRVLKEHIQKLYDENNQLETKLTATRGELGELNKKEAGYESKIDQLKKSIRDDQASVKQQEEEIAKQLSVIGISKARYNEIKTKVTDYNKLSDRVKGHEQQKYNLTMTLKDLTERTKDKVISDLSIFEDQLKQVHDSFNLKNTQLSHFKMVISNNIKIIEEIKRINEAIGTVEKRYQLIGHLSAVANGKNNKQLSFERYVLAAFLEDILDAANLRLLDMTGGRYYLMRSEDLQRKNRQSGLELEVFDQYTGLARHVKTLSGGESFKASLAMALGLSDVVQAYAGGVKLDTMFIDEGFGTLDQESLDSAINCLIDLQKTGRLVGIISHVSELKERIDTRLEVYMDQRGSKTRFVLA